MAPWFSSPFTSFSSPLGLLGSPLISILLVDSKSPWCSVVYAPSCHLLSLNLLSNFLNIDIFNEIHSLWYISLLYEFSGYIICDSEYFLPTFPFQPVYHVYFCRRTHSHKEAQGTPPKPPNPAMFYKKIPPRPLYAWMTRNTPWLKHFYSLKCCTDPKKLPKEGHPFPKYHANS